MVLRCDNLRAEFLPGQPVLAGVSAAFLPGEFTAVLGPNGAGKSTLLRALAGIDPPPHRGKRGGGGVFLDGVAIGSLSPGARAARLTCLPQREDIPTGFTVREVVGFGVGVEAGFEVGAAVAESGDERIEQALARTGLNALASRRVEALSEGQRQRVSLARAFAQTRGASAGPGVVLADEPAAALDPALALDAMTFFRELARRGRTVVVVLHDMNLALRFADRAVLLGADGRVAADGPVAAVLTPAVLEAVFGVPWAACALAGGGSAVIPSERIPTI